MTIGLAHGSPAPSRLSGAPSPEMEVLLCCARSRMDEPARERLGTLLERDLDWQHLMRTSELHGVTPLLYSSLFSAADERVPPSVLAKLKFLSVDTIARNTYLTDALLEVLSLFSDHDIAAVPIKGPVLAATAYRNPALRQFGDLDIMVRRRDVQRAVQVLKDAGYRPASKSPRPQPLADILRSRVRKDAGFMREDNAVFVEIHWAFLPEARSFLLSPEEAWRSCADVSVAGTNVPSFAVEHVLLFLCAHGAKHAWTRLKWICDVAELIRAHEALDWDRVVRDAQRLRSERLLRTGLLLASELLGAELPAKMQAYVEGDGRAARLSGEVSDNLALGTAELERWAETLFWIKSREEVRDKLPAVIYYLLRHAVRPSHKDQELISLPRSLSFLYYLIRPARLIAERRGGSDRAERPATDIAAVRPELDEARPCCDMTG